MKSSITKIFLVVFCIIVLTSFNFTYGMFDQHGQWICSRQIDIETSYYQSYTDSFQNVIDQVYQNAGTEVTQAYFHSAIKEEQVGQDWKRSQDCLVSLGLDISELPQIVIPEDRDPTEIQIRNPVTDKPLLAIPNEEVQQITPEFFESEPVADTSYGIIAVIIIIVIGTMFFLIKIRSKSSDTRFSSRNYDKNNKTKDEDNYGDVEIEIKGGIEK